MEYVVQYFRFVYAVYGAVYPYSYNVNSLI